MFKNFKKYHEELKKYGLSGCQHTAALLCIADAIKESNTNTYENVKVNSNNIGTWIKDEYDPSEDIRPIIRDTI